MTRKHLERATLVLLGLTIAFLSVNSVRLDSATADEGAHLAAGLVRLQHGSFQFYPGQPPLIDALLAIPPALTGVRVPPLWRTEEHWTVGHAVLYRSGHDAATLLMLARLPIIALFVGLCFAVYWFVRDESGNEVAALVAMLMTGLCPDLMAHGRLATVDLGATAFIFVAMATFLRLLRQPSTVTAIACGVLTACAILSKTTALILLPSFVVLLVIRRKSWKPIAIAVAAAIVVVYGVYLALANHDQTAMSLAVLPFHEYAQTLEEIRHWYTTGHIHPQFLLGEFSYTGWPDYYPVALLLKTPIAAQILFFVACVVAARRRRFALIVCVSFVFVFLAIAATSKINLGIRYVLPIFPFVYASIGLALAEAARDVGKHAKPLAAAVALLVGWHVWANASTYPSYISYFNEIIGSHRNADRFLIDSNLDWGQDLHRLKIWCDENGVDFIRVDYFGGGEPAYEFGRRAVRFPAPRPQLLPRGWFAVSRHFYRISFFANESPVDYDAYLAASRAEYVDTVGGSIDVYRVR